MKERWKDVKGYKGLYQISDWGRVKSLARTRIVGYGGAQPMPERILKGTATTRYHQVFLYKNKVGVPKLVHRLVAEAFISNPKKKREVNHKDGNGRNNHWTNLEWATRQENFDHAAAMGWTVRGETVGTSSITEGTAKEVIKRLVAGDSIKKVATDLKIGCGCVSGIARCHSWMHLGRPDGFREILAAHIHKHLSEAGQRRWRRWRLSHGH
jgi:hypothetical protein